MATTHLMIARHGETEWNQIKRLQGRLDSPLTPKGIKQAKALAELTEEFSIDQIICSPLGRALTSATICQQYLNVPLEENANIVERHFGEWQGALFDTLRIEPHFEDVFFKVNAAKPPNGESGVDCADRIISALIRIAESVNGKKENAKVLVVMHGDAIRCSLASLSTETHCDAYSEFGNGKIFPVVYHHGTRKLTYLPLAQYQANMNQRHYKV